MGGRGTNCLCVTYDIGFCYFADLLISTSFSHVTGPPSCIFPIVRIREPRVFGPWIQTPDTGFWINIPDNIFRAWEHFLGLKILKLCQFSVRTRDPVPFFNLYPGSGMENSDPGSG
jgi:hypothetical protein